MVSKGRAAAYGQTHARVLLLSDENQAGGAMRNEEIARALKVGTATVSGCAAGAWRRGLMRPWGAGSNCAAVRGSWMARVRAT